MIEVAQLEDLPDVVNLILKRGEEFDYESHGFPLPQRDAIVKTVVKGWQQAPCFLVKVDGQTVGCASLTLFSFGWSDEKVLSSFMVYILPKHRNNDRVKGLYGAIKDYANCNGLLYADDYIAIDRVAARQRLMRSLEFQESGYLFTYNGKS